MLKVFINLPKIMLNLAGRMTKFIFFNLTLKFHFFVKSDVLFRTRADNPKNDKVMKTYLVKMLYDISKYVCGSCLLESFSNFSN